MDIQTFPHSNAEITHSTLIFVVVPQNHGDHAKNHGTRPKSR